MISTLSVLTLPSSGRSAFGERPLVGCFVVGIVKLFGVVDVVDDEEVLFFKTVAILVRIFFKSPLELRMKFFSFDNSSFSGGFVLALYLFVLEVVVLVVVEVLIVEVVVAFSIVDAGMSLFVLVLLLF